MLLYNKVMFYRNSKNIGCMQVVKKIMFAVFNNHRRKYNLIQQPIQYQPKFISLLGY